MYVEGSKMQICKKHAMEWETKTRKNYPTRKGTLSSRHKSTTPNPELMTDRLMILGKSDSPQN